MANETIEQISRAKSPVNTTDYFEGQDGTGSYKAQLSDIVALAGGGLTVTDGTHTVNPATEINFTSGATVTDAGGGVADVAVSGGGGGFVATSINLNTSNAAPTDITLDLTTLALVVNVTTDGSGLPQVVNLPNFTLVNNTAPAFNGYRVSIVLEHLGVGGDTLFATTPTGDGASEIFVYDPTGSFTITASNTGGGGPANSIPFGTHVGNCADFVWIDGAWFFDNTFNQNFATISNSAKPLTVMQNGTIAGGVAGNHTVAGINVGDVLAGVVYFAFTAGVVTSLGTLTGEFTITAANTINNTGGTNTTGGILMVTFAH